MKIDEYWQLFKEKNGLGDDIGYDSYYFCDNEKDANELGKLVLAGKKRATASCAMCCEYEKEPLPQSGDLCIITDFSNRPLCIVETTHIDIVPFKDVSPEFAALEGEGDCSLDYWRKAHEYFFTKELEELGLQFTQDMPVVCEMFKVVYK